MKLIPCLTQLALVSFLAGAPSAPLRQGPKPINALAHGVGRWVPDLAFTTLEGKKGKLSDFKNEKALVIAFTGASCPLSKRFASTLAAIEKEYGRQEVAFLYVDPIAIKGAEEDIAEMASFFFSEKSFNSLWSFSIKGSVISTNFFLKFLL